MKKRQLECFRPPRSDLSSGFPVDLLTMGGAATFSVMVFVVVSDWYGPPIAEREEIARNGVLACCVLIGSLVGGLAARQEFRLRTRLLS